MCYFIIYNKLNWEVVNINRKIVNISESFSLNKFYRSEGAPGAGEARLYVGPRNDNDVQVMFSASAQTVTYKSKTYQKCTYKGVISKKNLLDYMWKCSNEFRSPIQDYNENPGKMSKRYNEIMLYVSNLREEEVEFDLFDHQGTKDSARFYINSTHEIWKIMRSALLPKISQIELYLTALGPNGRIRFNFELNSRFARINKSRAMSLVEMIKEDEGLKDTEKERLIASRVGQGKFRNDLIKIFGMCAFTGIRDVYLLRASHIKPWSASDNFERLDPGNGLLLSPTYDVLFDQGLISFDEKSCLLISPYLSREAKLALGLQSGQHICFGPLEDERQNYMTFHRKHIFKKE